MTHELKLVFVGSMGAGKTTAIRTISEIEPITTDVYNTDQAEFDKDETTVAMDYGELTLQGGETLRLYGTPGQERFDFMWPIVADGALGAILLIDNSRPDPLADMEIYLQAFRSLADAGAVVVGVGRMNICPQPSLDAYAERLEQLSVLVPVMPADVRERRDVLDVLEVLFQQIEATEQSAEMVNN
ncbi:MAG: GTP-binding protein [Acidiferrobacter sp.]